MHEVAFFPVADPCLHRPGGSGGDGGVGHVVELGAVDVGPGGTHLQYSTNSTEQYSTV